jgi:hypothetical protein
LQYWGRSNTHQHWFAIGLRFGQKFFNVAFCSYLHLQYFNWAAVPGGRFSNSPTSQSPIVACKRMDTVQLIIIFSLLTSVVCIWKKINLVIFTKILTGIHLLFLFLTISVVVLLFNNFKLIGTFSNTIAGIAFMVSGILLFGLTKNKILKLYTGIIFSVNAIFQIALFFAPNGLLLFYGIAFYLFQPPYMTKNLTPTKQIEFYEPFLGPPPIYLTEEKFGILKSQRLMIFQKEEPYYKPNINDLKIISDTAIECSITLNKDNTIKDTLITK